MRLRNGCIALALCIGPVVSGQADDNISDEECQALSDSLSQPYHSLCTSYAGGVTPIQLASNPDEYAGRIVAAWGIIALGMETSALTIPELPYPSLAVWLTYSESCQIDLPGNGFSMRSTLCDDKTLAEINGRRVMVRGRYSDDGHGHMGMYPGTIEEVFSIFVLPEEVAE